MINLNATKEDRDLIAKIVDRAAKIHEDNSPALIAVSPYDRVSAKMDLTATHLNGCPLDLARLAEADDFNLAHDVFGIARHLNRETGKLEGFFRPRFASKAS